MNINIAINIKTLQIIIFIILYEYVNKIKLFKNVN